MTLRIEERREAHNELLAQFDFYEQRRDGLGFQFLHAVDAALSDIAEWPDSWPPYPDGDSQSVLRTRRVTGFPVRVIYLVDSDIAVVFAYAPDRREPGYRRNRLDGDSRG